MPTPTTHTKEMKVVRNYSFWQHPIKWWKDRKKIKIMDFWVNRMWDNGMKEEVKLINLDLLRFGTAIMDKDGARVDPAKFFLSSPNTEME